MQWMGKPELWSMASPTVCAVVVTYHPDADVLANLATVRPQVDLLVVVDNGSSAADVHVLREATQQLNAALIENAANLGIATALNQGIRWALEQSAAFCLLFDQDSTVTPGMVATLLQCFQSHPLGDRLGLLVPRYIDKRDGATLPPFVGKDGALNGAMTSGTFLPASLIGHAGYFADDYFIDSVDYEYSLRVRSAGFSIAECPQAILMHSPGTPTLHPHLFKSGHFQAANYSPLRRYYQERNKILMTRRHWRRHLWFCLGQFYLSAKELVKILVYEPRAGKAKKLRYFFRGWIDGLLGRSGKLHER
jgi:rhamnosyltransferase